MKRFNYLSPCKNNYITIYVTEIKIITWKLLVKNDLAT